ncbi:MAG TPA: hypothetical protein VF421_20750 [Niabella sp.]
MITKEICIKGAAVHAFIRNQMEQKARELDITGALVTRQDGNLTLISSGTENNVKSYITWFKNIGELYGFNPEVKNVAFRAFHKFSLS